MLLDTGPAAAHFLDGGAETRVVTYGAGPQTITGTNFERPRFEHTPVNRLAARVIRYRVADSPARIFGITQDQALFVLPRP